MLARTWSHLEAMHGLGNSCFQNNLPEGKQDMQIGLSLGERNLGACKNAARSKISSRIEKPETTMRSVFLQSGIEKAATQLLFKQQNFTTTQRTTKAGDSIIFKSSKSRGNTVAVESLSELQFNKKKHEHNPAKNQPWLKAKFTTYTYLPGEKPH